MYWPELDLQSWKRLSYAPLERSALMPRSIHRPDSLVDINNIAYGVVMIPDLSVFRLLDDAISPVSGGRQPMTALANQVEGYLRRRPNALVSQGAQVPDVPGVALADYSMTSQGNLQADGSRDRLGAKRRQRPSTSKMATPLKREISSSHAARQSR